MARRRRRLGRGTLAFGGAIFVAIAIMLTFFPNIVSTILPSDTDSGTWTFAFPDIDTIQKFPQATVLTPTGFSQVSSSIVQCDFKFRVQAFNDRGSLVEQRFTGFSDPNSIFTTFELKTRTTTGTQGTFSEFSIGNLSIEKYEITPIMKCQKKTGDLNFQSGVIVKQSPITLDTFVTKPDGSVVKLAQQQLTIQTTGSEDTSFFFASDFFGLIPNIFDSRSGIMNNNVDIFFKGVGGTLNSAVQKFTIQASAIDKVLPAQVDVYNSQIRFQMRGTLGIDYVFNPTNTQIFVLDPSTLQKTLYVKVDKVSEVSPTDPSQIPQTIDIINAKTASGKTLVTTTGSGQSTLNPDEANDRRIFVTASLDGFQFQVETTPKVSLRHLSGSIVSGSNVVNMQHVGGGQFTHTGQSLNVPSNILDGSYHIQVENSRTNKGTATIIVKTPSPTTTQPETCTAPLVPDGMGGCKKESTTQQCDPDKKLIGGVCVQQFCEDGNPVSATGGCLIKVTVGEECRGSQIDNGDGTCTQPNCGVGLEWNQSTFRCEVIDCQPVNGVNHEYDTILLSCQPSKLECMGGDVPNADKTACISITEVRTIGGEEETNVLNIRQELRYTLVTSDQSGLRTPVESGIIPPDESLFVGLTQLQFLTEPSKANPLGAKFDIMEVESFLVVPRTLSSPQITNVNLNQQLFFYHKNTIGSTGVPTNNIPALVVNLPSGIISDIKTESGGGFFRLGKMTIETSEILSAVTGVTGATNCFEEGEVCTTVGGVELKEGEMISIMYVIKGTFDLTTDGGTKQFDGVIKQMRYWKNLVFTDKVLNGDQCIGKSGRALLQCLTNA